MPRVKAAYKPFQCYEYFIKDGKRVAVIKVDDRIISWKRYRQNPDIVDAQFIRTQNYFGKAIYNQIGIIQSCIVQKRTKNRTNNISLSKKVLDFINKTKTIDRTEYLRKPNGQFLPLKNIIEKVYFNKGQNREEIGLISALERG